MRDEIIENVEATYKETDLFKMLQTGDLANMDALPAEQVRQKAARAPGRAEQLLGPCAVQWHGVRWDHVPLELLAMQAPLGSGRSAFMAECRSMLPLGHTQSGRLRRPAECLTALSATCRLPPAAARRPPSCPRCASCATPSIPPSSEPSSPTSRVRGGVHGLGGVVICC